VLTPVFNSRKPCRSRFLFCARPSLYIMCLSVVYRHLFYFFFLLLLLIFFLPHRALHGRPPSTMRHGRRSSGSFGPKDRWSSSFAVKASAVRHREGVVDGGPGRRRGWRGRFRPDDGWGWSRVAVAKRKHAYYTLLSSPYIVVIIIIIVIVIVIVVVVVVVVIGGFLTNMFSIRTI